MSNIIVTRNPVHFFFQNFERMKKMLQDEYTPENYEQLKKDWAADIEAYRTGSKPQKRIYWKAGDIRNGTGENSGKMNIDISVGFFDVSYKDYKLQKPFHHYVYTVTGEDLSQYRSLPIDHQLHALENAMYGAIVSFEYDEHLPDLVNFGIERSNIMKGSEFMDNVLPNLSEFTTNPEE